MQNIVIPKPYRFVPPRFSRFWARIIQWYLPTYLHRSFGITSWECVGTGEMLIVLVLRAHYTLDVLAGMFAAFFAADVAGRLSPVVDAWLRK